MTSVPLAIAWSARDETSGVADVSLEAARGSALWSRVVNGVTETGSTVSIDRGAAWRFRLAARDVAGNVSVPAESSPVTAQVAEDRSAQLAYTGRWTTVQRTSASGGTVRYAKETGATVTYRFTGRSVAWVAAVAPHHGRARVLLDGRRVATVDLGAAAQQRRLVFVQNWATAGPHTITIRVLGTAGRPRVELDGFVILN
jgi:hypothetical protein